MTEFVRGGWTTERIALMPAAWNTESNAAAKLASRSCRTNFAPCSCVLQVHEQVPGLLHCPRLDRMLGSAGDPDAPGAVLDDGKDVDLSPREHAAAKKCRARILCAWGPEETPASPARLEQARGPRPSSRILDSVTDALKLRQAERAHLFRLAGVPLAAPDQVSRQVRPHVAALLDRMPDSAAIVTAAPYDVIAWNPLAQALFGEAMGGDRPNLARRRFLNRDEVLTTGHEDFGQIAVARLRAAAARSPLDTPSRMATL
jgi:hypothetical protein